MNNSLIAYSVCFLVGGVATLILLNLYRTPRPGSAASPYSWLTWLECNSEDLGLSYRNLALVSLLGLFLEMLVIRWVSSELRIFAYFKNLVLIASFLGFGMGCYLSRRALNLLSMLVPPVLIAFFVKLPWEPLRQLVRDLPEWLGASSEVHYWGVATLPPSLQAWTLLVNAILITVPLFALIALMFVPIGQLVGRNLERCANGIRGYSINVLASLGGILLYTLLCFLNQPPATWFAIAGVLAISLFWHVPRFRWSSAAGAALCVGLVSFNPAPNSKTYWSPYQKLTLTPVISSGETISLALNTNDSWYQQILDLSPRFVEKHPDLFHDTPIEWNPYNLPYRLHPRPQNVLVLGSGMGNDVAAALRNGAGRVVAVEIDPLIASLGRTLHFEKPYSSPRVNLIIDDARSYLQKSMDQFDLIACSLLDSHTTSSHYSNIRIDNYVYTREAMAAARRLLRPDGLFIVKFQVDTPWIAGRLEGLIEQAYGLAPIEFRSTSNYGTGGSFFVAGSEEQLDSIRTNSEISDFIRTHPPIKPVKATLTTDNWPYFYQHEPGLPVSVIATSGVLLLLCVLLMRNSLRQGGGLRWHFFFLGAAFLLLEAQIISKMALLFGTTWLVNSIVVSALMGLILGSNWLVGKFPAFPTGFAYLGLLGSLVIAYITPMSWFFFESFWLRAVVSLAMLCAPVFFAGIVFVQSFARAGFSGEALGSNLIGALAGGLLESMSMWTGIKSLVVIAALFYLGAYLAQHVGAREQLEIPEPVKVR